MKTNLQKSNSKIRIILLTTVLIILSATISFSEQYGGETAANFLKIGIGAQSAGMGGAYTAVADGAVSSFWNPANLTLSEKRNLILGHQSLLQDISLDYGSVGFGIADDWRGNLAIIYMGYGDIPGYDGLGNSTGSYLAYDLMVSASGSYQINPDFSAGLTLKLIHQKLDQVSGTAPAIDFGLKYSKGIWQAGLVLSNFGSKMKFLNTEEKLPTEIRFGLAARPFVSDVTLALDLAQQFNGGLKIANGLQVGFEDQYFVRGGMEYKQSGLGSDWQATYSTGLGLLFNEYAIDYSFTIGDDLTEDDLHRFSVGYSF